MKKPYYAHKLTRLLFKSCAAQSIGQDAVLLIIHIAHTEDAAKYQGPVRFWNSQLNEVLGFHSPKSLNNARRKAVEAGWLEYDRKNDRSDGVYSTKIPPHVENYDDNPIEPIPSTEQETEKESGFVGRFGNGKRNRKVTGNGSLPIPIPKPIPIRDRARKYPTIEEWKAYWESNRLFGDPEASFDHYESVGWVSGKNPIKDWRAAARTSSRNQEKWSKESTSRPKTRPSDTLQLLDGSQP